MKKVLLVLLTSLMVSSLAISQANQKPLILKRTASWCGPCGSWGWNFFKDLLDEFPADQATVLAMPFSGEHTTDMTIELAANFDAFGQPRFYLNSEDQNVSSSTVSQGLDRFKTAVSDANGTMSKFDMTIKEAGYDDDLMAYVDLEITIAEDLDAEYFVATYFVADGYEGIQSGQGSDANHRRLLRAAYSDIPGGEENTFGVSFADANSANGQTINISLYHDVQQYEDQTIDAYDAAVVIWRLDADGRYYVETSTLYEDFSIISAVENQSLQNASLNASFQEESLVLFLNGFDQLAQTNLVIQNLNHNIITNETFSQLSNESVQSYDLSHVPAGMYIIKAGNDKDGYITTKAFKY